MSERDDTTLGMIEDAPPRRAMRRSDRDAGPARELAVEAARLAGDLRCENVLLLDTRGLSELTDFVVIATGTSDRQIRSVGDDISDLARQRGFDRYGREQDPRTTWVVLDFVDVVVHLFEPATRAHYDLEMLWGDAPRLTWQRTARSDKTT